MKSLKRSLIAYLCLFSFICGHGGILFAQDDMNFHIIPEVKQSELPELAEDVSEVGGTAWEVWKNYNQTAKEYEGKWEVWKSIATGIMTRNTILQYLVYLTKFLSQIGLFIGALMIIFAGYKYATRVFWGKTNEGNTAIKYAIIGVLVISFSYAIMKFFTSAFLGS